MATRQFRIIASSIFMILFLVMSGHYAYSEKGTTQFDHFQTGFPLIGSHIQVECERCHKNAVFSGTPRNCRNCHNGDIAPAKTQSHVATSAECDQCHNETAWSSARFDHSTITTSCRTCHNGVIAVSKPVVGHPNTSSDCSACHNSTVNFAIDGRAVHAAAGAKACSSPDCHGPSGTGRPKSIGHINSTNTCDDCHNQVGFRPLARMDHIAVIGTCSGCHKASIPPGHPNIGTQECDACHNTIAFNQVTGGAKPALHVPTTLGCDSCHVGATTSGVINFSHGDTGLLCSQCHTGSIIIKGTAKKSSAHPPTTVIECEDCHTTNGTFSSNERRPPGHPSGMAGRGCISCHNPLNTGFGFSRARDGKGTHKGDHPPSARFPNPETGAARCTNCHGTNFTQNIDKKYADNLGFNDPNCGGGGCHPE